LQYFGEREVSVAEIIDRWLDPTHRYFKLNGDDGVIYLVRQDTIKDHWELTMFNNGTQNETRLSST
jgi:hypothetical protein